MLTGNSEVTFHLNLGTPIRIEVGPKDVENNEVKLARRVDGEKKQVKLAELLSTIQSEFKLVHELMYQNAVQKFEASKARADNFAQFMEHLNHKKMILAPWCDDVTCEKKVKELSGMLSKADETENDMSGSAKTLCKPLVQEPLPEGTKCFAHEHCGNLAKVYCYWGRSY